MFNVFVWGFGVVLSGVEFDDLFFNEFRGELNVMKFKFVVRVDLNGGRFIYVFF